MTFTFRHPKHYAELRAERRKLQAASDKLQATSSKQQESRPERPSAKVQASSDGELRARSYAKFAFRLMGKP